MCNTAFNTIVTILCFTVGFTFIIISILPRMTPPCPFWRNYRLYKEFCAEGLDLAQPDIQNYNQHQKHKQIEGSCTMMIENHHYHNNNNQNPHASILPFHVSQPCVNCFESSSNPAYFGTQALVPAPTAPAAAEGGGGRVCGVNGDRIHLNSGYY
ncbi:hypothetical protein F4703DRAFT_1860697 [Phycomyces blakesleeanus]